mgnify:CR=1 FL=1
MCGINGILSSDLTDKLSLIQRMNDNLRHRGPDNADYYLNQNIALGHQRLAIIDLTSDGNQPMLSKDGRYVLVYNGEIYNFNEIKNSLDYEFESKTDSEVILASYIKWGAECVKFFNGMFAFAIWDNHERKLFLARDRLGIKPLYYYKNNNVFLFSSEIRSLLSTNLIDPSLSLAGLVEYLKYQTVHSPNTILENIHMLEPGYYIHYYRDYKIEKRSYWHPGLNQFDVNNLEKNDLKDCILDSLTKAVNIRMYSDVESGAFLSGGIDSSTIVSIMSNNSSKMIKTYNVSFDEDEYDESRYAKLVAERYGTDHTEIRLTSEMFLQNVSKALNDMDHPSGDGVNSWVVSKCTRKQGVKMVFSGLGGDEIFAGYPNFKSLYRMDKYSWILRLPQSLKQKIIANIFYNSNDYFKQKVNQILKKEGYNFKEYYMTSRQVLLDAEIQNVLSNNIANDTDSYLLKEFGNGSFDSDKILSKISGAELQTYMQNVLLRDTDQMSMAHSLEVRVPFLDHNLVDLCLSINDRHKNPRFSKKLLIDSVSHLLPTAVYERKKMGFTFPWDKWLKNELHEFGSALIIDLSKRVYFNEKQILNLWSEYKKGNPIIKFSSIWSLIVLEHWLQNNNING